MIGEVESFVDERIEIHFPALAAPSARMIQHASNDPICPPSVFDDFFEVAGQHLHRVLDLDAGVLVEGCDGRRGGCAWPQFDPAPVKLNWHHELIAEHLEAVTRGEIRKLLISVPPRCSKTNLVNVCWPAWIWAQPQERSGPLSGPQVRFMCISYGQTLSIDVATTARRLVLGPWYQGHWGQRVVPLDDPSSKENFGTTAGGYRLATSMSGATLGRGGDIKILDDPNSVQ